MHIFGYWVNLILLFEFAVGTSKSRSMWWLWALEIPNYPPMHSLFPALMSADSFQMKDYEALNLYCSAGRMWVGLNCSLSFVHFLNLNVKFFHSKPTNHSNVMQLSYQQPPQSTQTTLRIRCAALCPVQTAASISNQLRPESIRFSHLYKIKTFYSTFNRSSLNSRWSMMPSNWSKHLKSRDSVYLAEY